MLHVAEKNRVLIKSARIQFPASFRLYKDGLLRLPPAVILKELVAPIVFVEGTLGGVHRLTVGRGTEVIVTEKVTLFCIFFKSDKKHLRIKPERNSLSYLSSIGAKLFNCHNFCCNFEVYTVQCSYENTFKR